MKLIPKRLACFVSMTLIVSLGAGASSTVSSQQNATILVAANTINPMNVLIDEFEKTHQIVKVTLEQAEFKS